jgi:hypothetical protein
MAPAVPFCASLMIPVTLATRDSAARRACQTLDRAACPVLLSRPAG